MFSVDRYRSWVILDNEDTKISDVYAYTVVDARRRASQRALEALMKKQPSHVNRWTTQRMIFPFRSFRRSSLVNQWSLWQNTKKSPTPWLTSSNTTERMIIQICSILFTTVSTPLSSSNEVSADRMSALTSAHHLCSSTGCWPSGCLRHGQSMSRARQCQRDGRILTGLSRLIAGTTSIHSVGFGICSRDEILTSQGISTANWLIIPMAVLFDRYWKRARKTRWKHNWKITCPSICWSLEHLLATHESSYRTIVMVELFFQDNFFLYRIALQVPWLRTIWYRCEQRVMHRSMNILNMVIFVTNYRLVWKLSMPIVSEWKQLAAGL